MLGSCELVGFPRFKLCQNAHGVQPFTNQLWCKYTLLLLQDIFYRTVTGTGYGSTYAGLGHPDSCVYRPWRVTSDLRGSLVPLLQRHASRLVHPLACFPLMSVQLLYLLSRTSAFCSLSRAASSVLSLLLRISPCA